jgi:hypothetical protein
VDHIGDALELVLVGRLGGEGDGEGVVDDILLERALFVPVEGVAG